MIKISPDVTFEQLLKLGFKKDIRPSILYSIKDELFGDIVVVRKDNSVSFYDFSDNIRFKMMQENLIYDEFCS